MGRSPAEPSWVWSEKGRWLDRAAQGLVGWEAGDDEGVGAEPEAQVRQKARAIVIVVIRLPRRPTNAVGRKAVMIE